ncbi:MAG: DUF2232 domain-containing protein [Thermoanaerobaculia bacterium]
MTVRFPRAVRLLFAPFWAGLGAALTIAIPPAGLALVPIGASRLARSAFAAPTAFEAFSIAALAPAAALAFGLLVGPGNAIPAALLAISLFSLPALALLAAARDGRRREEVLLVVASVSGIGLLAILLGVATGGRDPGPFLAARFDEKVPEILAFYRTSGWEESAIETTARLFRMMASVIAEQLPGLVLAAAVLFAGAVVYPLGRLWGAEYRGLSEPSFARFRTPFYAAVAFIPAGAVAAFAGPDARRAAVDVILPLVALFFLRGLAIIRALLDRGRAGLFLRALVWVVVFQMPLPLVLAFGGILDEFLDVRGRVDRWAAARRNGGPGEP